MNEWMKSVWLGDTTGKKKKKKKRLVNNENWTNPKENVATTVTLCIHTFVMKVLWKLLWI